MCGAVHLAAQLGIGALTSTFVDHDQAKHWVDDCYDTFKNECVPIGHAVNPNIALVTGFSVHPDEQEALDRGIDGLRFFQFALGHFYRSGAHKPGRTDIWQQYEATRDQIIAGDVTGNITASRGAIGTPDQVRAHPPPLAEIGVDQTVFIQQGGNNRHEHITDSLRLFADEVMPEFHAEEAERQRAKSEELAPYIEAAFARKQYMRPLTDEEIVPFAAGNTVAEESPVPVTGGD